MIVANETHVVIRSEADVLDARVLARKLASELGFGVMDQVLIATAVSEVGRNILLYAGQGEISIDLERGRGRPAITIIARDDGPGIADIAQAMQDGYTTSAGLGLGLPGSRRLMDEFDLASEVGKGTTVTMKKWRP